jgi:CRP-like cAMP-binding protein
VVRCCYPGDLIGESSVLGEPGASCTASVRAEGPAELWRFEGADLRALCTELPELRARIESESWIDRLDSFFSMRDNSDALDARVRDGILACMRAIRRVPAGELLIGAGAPPKTVYLIVEGVVEHRVPGAPPRRLDRDAFAGLHDALHDLAIEGKYVAVAPSNLVCFDGARLKALAADAPPQVAAALERLG